MSMFEKAFQFSGMSEYRLAEQASVSKELISDLKSGKIKFNDLKVEEAVKIAQVLRVSVEDLIIEVPKLNFQLDDDYFPIIRKALEQKNFYLRPEGCYSLDERIQKEHLEAARKVFFENIELLGDDNFFSKVYKRVDNLKYFMYMDLKEREEFLNWGIEIFNRSNVGNNDKQTRLAVRIYPKGVMIINIYAIPPAWLCGETFDDRRKNGLKVGPLYYGKQYPQFWWK